uniref:Uncharacterized protein n=1 Tax=Romanomermis culicivorax TaxID=13658 RepID=A0A915HI47_ROMCU
MSLTHAALNSPICIRVVFSRHPMIVRFDQMNLYIRRRHFRYQVHRNLIRCVRIASCVNYTDGAIDFDFRLMQLFARREFAFHFPTTSACFYD